MTEIDVRVQAEPFQPGVALDRLCAGDCGLGGLANFVGRVRGAAGFVLELEHYPGMTERVLADLADAAAARWDLGRLCLIHRHGRMTPGEAIVFVGAAARHRAAALDAVAFLIDRLKTEAPFWKREHRPDGSTAWVEARASDDARAAGWRA